MNATNPIGSLKKPAAPLGLLWIVFVAGVFASQVPLSQAEPPPLENVRYTENYSYLRQHPLDTKALEPWSALKYIPLDNTGIVYLTLGSEFRLRYELYADNNWGEGVQDNDGYLWSRALPLADLHLGKNVRVFGQLISAFVNDLDVPQSPVDENRLDTLQAFIDVRLPSPDDVGGTSITLRPGRQLLQYGSGRLIDVRYGPNVLETFDAAKTFVEGKQWKIDFFYARPVESAGNEFDDSSYDDRSMWSVYSSFKPQESPTSFDLYYIGYRDVNASFNQGSGRELRHTVASRIFGEAEKWDWNFEFFYQFGDFYTDVSDNTIAAWSAASDTGYTLPETVLQPRIGLRANIISGDRNPNDNRLETFNPLFPKGKYFGELSPVAPYNLVHLNPYVRLKVSEKLQITGNTAFYRRQSNDDGIYSLGGSLIRSDGDTSSRYIGTQAEVLAEYQASRHLSILVSYSIFTAGDFIKATGAHDTIHFAGFESIYRF